MKSVQHNGANLRTATPMSFSLIQNPLKGLFSIFFFTSILLGSSFGRAAATAPVQEHVAVIHLSSNDISKLLVSSEDLFVGVPGFEGMTGEAVLNPLAHTLVYSLNGSSGINLPPNQNIALLQLEDPVNGEHHDFLLKTDGGGIIMILDDF